MRMHGTPNRTGAELSAMLSHACSRLGVNLLTDALVTDLYAQADGRIRGVRVQRPDGSSEDIGCEALILACCGFAGNRNMLAEFIPEILDAEFFGHPGNQGDAIRWGLALGATIADISSYQGHGGLAAGYGMPILWPLIMQGGFQVNALGQRFANEALGYSEHAVEVVAQPGGCAWMIYDTRLHELMQEFDDYRQAMEANAIRSAADAQVLAEVIGLPTDVLADTLAHVAAMTRGDAKCPFGREFSGKPPLEGPYFAVKVYGAIFHTQGGLVVDGNARVVRKDGGTFPNLFAGGGAARGISGPSAWGYMAGNGLLTATTLGRLAGEAAASDVVAALATAEQ
jgi:fumarate reductase flavoprotein subunit